MAYTITYTPTSPDSNAGGWVSFYTFHPEYMIDMNSDFFSFKNGNLNIHNTDDNGRATFYREEGIDGDSSLTPFGGSNIKTCFNETPIKSKVFKAIRVVSDTNALSSSLQTDINSGSVSSFTRKENSSYSSIKQDSPPPEEMRYFQGVGEAGTGTGAGSGEDPSTTDKIEFGVGFPLNSAIRVNDAIYANSVLIGFVTKVVNRRDRVAIEIVDDAGRPAPASGNFISFVARSSENESSGITGHFMDATININTPLPAELYALEADYMESKP